MKQNLSQEMQQGLALAFVGMEMVAPIVVGIAIDWHWNCSPWGVSIGAAAGLIGGVGQLYLMARQWSKQEKQVGDDSTKRDV